MTTQPITAGRRLAALVLLAWSAQLCAATITVDSIDDPGDGDCSNNGCTLREAVAEAADGDEIVFDVFGGGVTTATITLSGSAITIDKSLTITGADGLRIDGNEQSGIFATQGAGLLDFEISTLVLENGSASEGGAIDNSENLTLIDVDFLNNQAVTQGGAIDSRGGQLIVRSCLFQGNEVADPTNPSLNGGGAIHSFGAVTVEGSEFVENQALTGKNGGAIFLLSTSGSLDLQRDGTRRTRFIDNTATGNGGAIVVMQSDRVDGFLVEFDGNSAGDGGAVWVDDDISEVRLLSSRFVNNQADRGGAIFTSSRLDLQASAFGSNSASLEGGAIWHDVATDSTIVRTLFTANSAHLGGALLNDTDGLMTIENSTFSANLVNLNTGSAGGAIYNRGAAVTLRSLSLVDNTSTGPADALHGGFDVVNTIVDGPAPADNCADTSLTVSNGHNMDNGQSCGFDQPGDLANTDPQLEPLTPSSALVFTQVHQPLPGSPAIDSGSDADCPFIDQVGTNRPQDGDLDGIDGCDIGAVEVNPLIFRDRFEF